jgi:hypothetical protein
MTKNRRRDDDTVDQVFAQLGLRPELRLAIRRIEPEWCAKYLGTIYIDQGDEFCLETIKRRYGGGKFQIKLKDARGRYLGHRTVTIFGEPLENGLPVQQPVPPMFPFA